MKQTKSAAISLVLYLFIISTCSAQNILMPYRIDSLWGYADTTGKIIVTPQFKFADLFRDDFPYAYIGNRTGLNNTKGLIKNTGEIIIAPNIYHQIIPLTVLTNYSLSNQKPFLPLRMEATIEKNRYSKKSHWTDSLPLFMVAFKLVEDNSYKKTGVLFDSAGNKILNDVYDNISIFAYKPQTTLFLLEKNNKFGIANSNGKILLPIEFEQLDCTYEENDEYTIIAKKGGKYGLINLKNKVLLPIKYTGIRKEYYSGNYNYILAINDNGKEAAYDRMGKMVNPFSAGRIYAEYDYSNPSKYKILRRDIPSGTDVVQEGVGVVEMPKREDEMSAVSIMPVEDNSRSYNNTKSNETEEVFAENNKYGLRKGATILIPAQYESMVALYTGSKSSAYIVRSGIMLGIVNNKNETIISTKYTELTPLFENRLGTDPFYLAKRNNKYGIISFNNRIIIPCNYNHIATCKISYIKPTVIAACSNDNQTHFYDTSGTLLYKTNYAVTKPLIAYPDSLQQALWLVENNQKETGMVNYKGELLLEPSYSKIELAEARNIYQRKIFLAIKNKEGKTGLSSMEGKTMIPAIYDTISNLYIPFNERKKDSIFYFVAVQNGKTGLINQHNDIIIPFQNNVAIKLLMYNAPWLVIYNKTGQGLASIEYPELIPLQKNVSFAVSDNESRLIEKGIVYYKDITRDKDNIGVYLLKNHSVVKIVPAVYTSIWNSNRRSYNKNPFEFIGLVRTIPHNQYSDYIGLNGVTFFEH